MLERLHEMAAIINSKDAHSVTINDISNDHVIAIQTPFLKRVLSIIPQSKDLLFYDSCRNVDQNNCRLFQILVTSPLGGLPVGVLITTSESEEVLTEGFLAWKNLATRNPLFGNTSPATSCSHDRQLSSREERSEKCFPQNKATLVHLLCFTGM